MAVMYGITKEQQREVVRKKVAELHVRLENGWRYLDTNPGDTGAMDLFLDLLKKYERKYFEWLTLGGNAKEGYL